MQGAGFIPHEEFNILVSDIDCQSKGGVIGQLLTCVWKIGSRERETFRNMVRQEQIVQVLEYSYSFRAIASGVETDIQHSIPVFFSNLEQGDYFFDSKGKPIKD